MGEQPVALVIDRFEGSWAVLLFGRQGFNFPRALLPPAAREGDMLKIAVEVDAAATKQQRRRIMKLEDDLFR
ncbi:MAG: DUF3006 domain-containing protein [Ignavibacteriales bacterium]